MSTKYVVDDWRPEIKACECTKETAAFVWLKGFYRYNPDEICKQKKAGKMFDTWEEAHAELTRRADAKLNAARRQLEQAQAFAGNVRGMKPPQSEEVES
jgi:hypothetical protein